MYYRINRKTDRIENNLLEWERSWKNVKILKYPPPDSQTSYDSE